MGEWIQVCFSTTADVVAGSVLAPVAVASLFQVRRPRQLLFAALPAVFAVHQLVESLVWAGDDGDVSAGLEHAAAVAYAVIAFPLLPLLFPVAVVLIEPRAARRAALPFVALGTIVSGYLAYAMAAHGVRVTAHPHALSYDIGADNGGFWAVLYVIAVIGPALLSKSPSIRAFGAVNLVGLTVVALAYAEAFASLWCVYAAATSVLVLVHLRREPPHERNLGDTMRLEAGSSHATFGEQT
jgi:energy-converting hydrogenase Eha subunit E